MSQITTTSGGQHHHHQDKKQRGGGNSSDKKEAPKKKESIVDLARFMDKSIRVKFQGGREVTGILKGFDPLLNLVLDDTLEYQRDAEDSFKLTEDVRRLGLVVCRGPTIVVVAPTDGMEQIENPFVQ